MLKQSYSFNGVTDYITQYLISYMKKNGKSLPQLFNLIDKNGDGYIQSKEMDDLFKHSIVIY